MTKVMLVSAKQFEGFLLRSSLEVFENRKAMVADKTMKKLQYFISLLILKKKCFKALFSVATLPGILEKPRILTIFTCSVVKFRFDSKNLSYK